MRIVCDNCGAKYQIADEKIAGKMFRVRCKKCSNMIMVDGTKVGGAVAAAAGVGPAASSGEGEWYVVIDGAQVGPLTVEQLQGHVSEGKVDGDSYGWREGMADWLRVADIPALSSMLSAGGLDGGEFEDEATRVVSSSERPSPSPEPAPAPAEAEAPAPTTAESAAPAPASPEPASGSSLLAAAAAAPAPAESASNAFFASTAAPSDTPSAEEDAGSASGFTGERNESSVLFSLSDLANTKSEARSDVPRTDGSGLIDIRTLASAQTALKPPTADDAGQAAPGALGGGQVAAPAVLAPMTLPPRKSSNGIYIAIGAMFLLIVALVIVVISMMKDEPAPTPVAVEPAAVEAPEAAASGEAAGEEDEAEPAAEPEPEADAVAAAALVEGSGEEADGSGEASGDAALEEEVAVAEAEPVAAEPAAEQPAAAAAAPEPAARPTRVAAASPATNERSAPASPSRSAAPEPEAAPPRPSTPPATERPAASAPAAPSGAGERDSDAVARALEAIRNTEEPEPAAAPEPEPEPAAEAIPESLSRSDVQGAIRRYQSRVANCRDRGEPGTYRVSFVVQPSGSVTNVAPQASDDVSQCIAAVVRDMTFPRFRGAAFPVTYPFRLR